MKKIISSNTLKNAGTEISGRSLSPTQSFYGFKTVKHNASNEDFESQTLNRSKTQTRLKINTASNRRDNPTDVLEELIHYPSEMMSPINEIYPIQEPFKDSGA